MKYLFICTISPVQSFIAQARKTQDLYAGSRILSELTQAGITAFGEHHVIFPNPTNDSKPNRFLGKVENCDNLEALGKKVENAIREKFKNLAYQALKSAGKEHDKPKTFDTQIENHLEIFWIFEQIETTYKDAYEKIEQNLGAIKNVRAFEQMPEQGRKCSLDGERNALFFGWNEDDKGKKSKPKFISNEAKPVHDMKAGEGLSAVSLTKRFYSNLDKKNSSFPSTAHVALMQMLSTVWKTTDGLQALALYKDEFIGTHFDEQLFYEENLTEDYFKKHQLRNLIDKLPTIKKKYQDLNNIVKRYNFKFDKYYALLCFDGDNMGKILSGELLQDKENTDFEAYQKELSTLLGKYAEWAKNYLTYPKGEAVYVGGDDFLGFVNLYHLFDVLKELREKFDCSVNKKLQEKYKLQPIEGFTFSAGIAIAHYKTPLDIVLKTARDMEHKAKEEGNRNAFAISVLKHSGESHETVYKFEKDNLTHIETIVKALQNEEVSKKFITVLAQEIRLLQDDKPDFFQKDIGRNIVFSEIKRTIERAKMPEKDVSNLITSVKNLFSEKTNNFIEAMQIARFINKELKND